MRFAKLGKIIAGLTSLDLIDLLFCSRNNLSLLPIIFGIMLLSHLCKLIMNFMGGVEPDNGFNDVIDVGFCATSLFSR